jgi:small subunit ribosomal protein S17
LLGSKLSLAKLKGVEIRIMSSIDTKIVRTISARVISEARDKTARVVVERRVSHPTLGKTIIKSSKYLIHDESNSCKLNDEVIIQSCTPKSKNKTWELVEITKGSEEEN